MPLWVWSVDVQLRGEFVTRVHLYANKGILFFSPLLSKVFDTLWLIRTPFPNPLSGSPGLLSELESFTLPCSSTYLGLPVGHSGKRN